MSGTLNKVMLIGHLGDEVKMHHFEGGGCIGRFPLATNESYTNKSTGEKISIVLKSLLSLCLNRLDLFEIFFSFIFLLFFSC